MALTFATTDVTHTLPITENEDEASFATPTDKKLALPDHGDAFIPKDESVIDSSEDETDWWDGVYATRMGQDEENEVDLLDACKANDIDTVLNLIGDDMQKSAVNLDCRITINHPNPPVYSRVRRTVMFEDSPFHVCCALGHSDLVKYFIKREECKFDTTDMEGRTPLHSAAAGGHLDICKMLLKEQQVPNMLEYKDRLGRTPTFLASQHGHPAVLKFLLTQTFRRHTSPDIPSKDSRTSLIAACRNGHFECVKLLIERGKSNVEASNIKGLRPLHSAALNGSLPIVQYLTTTASCSLNARDSHNRTAFFISCQTSNFPLVRHFCSLPSCDLKVAFARSYTGQEMLLSSGLKEMGYYVRDETRARDIARKERIEAANKELGRNNEGPKKKVLISEEEWKLVREFKQGRNLDVLDVIQNSGFPGWEGPNWAKKEFEDEEARKRKEMWEEEERIRKEREEEEERLRLEEIRNRPKVKAKDRRKKK
mmetsp:Transcript_15299/g.28568  ORF Transcript_15299/g.28568 Transcript_15299/m.28568 type:complete len:483 (-) Transcript_15299:71-1519(-)|eukprot:CAMPEP_0182520384 /NCGR_PEP_ID=MMETSP1321-20130603/45590_1 /TAXON_ID=91990 /ORGANISM="Bolidomonas sp., Strain RCC1657" /LENGTH=482 /DNA_ID=CAMNT_0024728397 /DNA_START=88 /DNA_END=1536 /DNA_ORIENTATION=-